MIAMDPRVKAALEIAVRKREKRLSVKQIAEAKGVCLSPSRLEHLVKKETGLSLTKCLQILFMAEADNLLSDASRRIKDVSSALGYDTLAGFSHAYKKRRGRSPSRSRSRSVAGLNNKTAGSDN